MKESSQNFLLIKVLVGCISPELIALCLWWRSHRRLCLDNKPLNLKLELYHWLYNSILCPGLGRFEKLLDSMDPSVFLTTAAYVAETKQNCPTDTEKKRNPRCSWTTIKCRHGQGFKKKKKHSRGSHKAKFVLRWGPTHWRGCGTRQMTRISPNIREPERCKSCCVLSAQSGCQASAEVLMGWWEKKRKVDE